MVKHCLSKIVLIAILLLATTTQAFAQTTPAPSQSVQFNLNDVPASNQSDSNTVTQKSPAAFPVSLSLKVNSTDNNTIKGTLSFENGYLDDIPNLYYEVDLIPQKTTENISGLVAYIQSQPTYTIKSKTTQTIPFEIAYSGNIPSGEYALQAFVGTANKPVLASTSDSLTLTGSGTYIGIVQNSCAVVLNGKSYDPGIGAPFNPNETPTAQCTFVNKQNVAVVTKPSIDYAIRFISANPGTKITHVASNAPITFQPNEQKQVTIPLPALATPQVYQAFVTLVNENNAVVSTIIPFRWTVMGPSAYISNVKMSNNYFKKGSTASLAVNVSSSMDIFWRGQLAGVGTDLQNPVLSATITDEQGTLCGTKDQPLPKLGENNAAWPPQTINIPITKECINPKADVKLISDGKTLAGKTLQTLTLPSTLASSQTPWYKNPILLGSLGIVLLLIVVAIIVFILRRKRRIPLEVPPATPLVMFFILSATLIVAAGSFVHQALAYTIYPYNYNRANSGNPTPYYFLQVDGSCGIDNCDNNNESIQKFITGQLWSQGTGDLGNHGVILQGNFWTPGSKVRTINDNTIEVTFVGDVFDISCGNFGAGFLLSPLVNNRTDNIAISDIRIISTNSYWQTKTQRMWSGLSIIGTGDSRLSPTDINVSRDQGAGGGPIEVKFLVKKTDGKNFGPQDVFSLNSNLYLANGDGKAYSSSDDNQPVVEDSSNGPQNAYCGGRAADGSPIPGCLGRADIPIPGGYLEGANNATCTVSGWARLPATQYPSSNPQQTDVEIWNLNTLTRVKRFTPNLNRTDLSGNFGFSESLSGLIANNQRYNLGLYAVVGDGSDKLYTALLPENSSVNNPITLTCTSQTLTPTPTPPGPTCITPGPSTTPRIDPLEDILRVDASREGKGAGPGIKATYGVSGLNAGDPNLTPGIVSGDNYYNTLKIQPIFTSNERDLNQLSLVASAFTGTGGNKPAGSTLRDLVNSAQKENGFVVIYANPDATNLSANGKIQEAGFDFTPGSYYIIYNNTLTGPLINNFTPIKIVNPDGTSTTVLEAAKGIGTQKAPWAPSFDIRLYQPLGNRVWGTYIYLKYGSTSLSVPKTPLNSLSSQSAYNNSTSCIQAN